MDQIARPELEARLELIETRMDEKIARIEGRLDSTAARIEGKLDAAILELRLSREHMAKDVESIRTDVNEMRTDLKNARWQMLGLILAAVFAILFGVASFNATLLANMQSSFTLGKDFAKELAEAQRAAQSIAPSAPVNHGSPAKNP